VESSGRTRRLADDSYMDQQEMGIVVQANPPIVDHAHLMGTHDESCQEQ
jgi:hypothetical protein